VKQLVAIAFSLLLIVAQTFAVQVPVSSGVSVAKRSCCGDDCCCYVGLPVTPLASPVESAAPAAVQYQFVFSPVAIVIFTLAAPAGSLASASSSDSCVVVLPLFRRNCTLLI
jgi:hypothetical protein